MEANQDCPAYGRIVRSLVLLTNPEKPFPTTGKGTVQRFAALKLYKDEMETLYKNVALSNVQKEVEPTESIPFKPVPAKLISESPGVSLEGRPEAPMLCLQSELDARIEEALHRLLQTVLTQRLGPALVQMISQVCQPLLLKVRPSDLRAGHPSPPKDVENQSTANNKNNIQTGPASKSGLTKSVSPSHGQGDPSQAQDSHTLKEYLYQTLSDTTYLYSVTDDNNLFECGLDSLQAAALVERINSFLATTKRNDTPIQTRAVYENPTINQLLRIIESSG